MIEFFSESDFILEHIDSFKSWIIHSLNLEKHKLGELTIVFCDDTFLHQLNVEFLNHDTLTDIITFDYNQGDMIFGEIYISIERVKENAEEFSVSFDEELRRVIIHGVLHLCGYKDKSNEDKVLMRMKEDNYLALFNLPS